MTSITLNGAQKSPLFLISTGRCGSTFFSNSINIHPQLISISELFEPIIPVPYLDNINRISGKAFFKMLSAQTMPERVDIWLSAKTKECLYMPAEKERISLLLCYALPLLTDEPEVLFHSLKQQISMYPVDTPANHFIHFCEYLKEFTGKSLWIERSGGSLPHTREILNCWPKAKLIHFYRDGRETACSMRAHPVFRMFVMKRLGIQWNPDFYPPIEEFGKMWSEWVTEAVSAMQQANAEVLAISYESLMAEPEQALTHFLRFTTDRIKLTREDSAWIETVAAGTAAAPNHYSQLTVEEQSRLDETCGPGMRALGYPI